MRLFLTLAFPRLTDHIHLLLRDSSVMRLCYLFWAHLIINFFHFFRTKVFKLSFEVAGCKEGLEMLTPPAFCIKIQRSPIPFVTCWDTFIILCENRFLIQMVLWKPMFKFISGINVHVLIRVYYCVLKNTFFKLYSLESSNNIVYGLCSLPYN